MQALRRTQLAEQEHTFSRNAVKALLATAHSQLARFEILWLCGRNSTIGVCMRSQGAPFIECSEYLKQFASEERISDYFALVTSQVQEDFEETQKQLALHLFKKMREEEERQAAHDSAQAHTTTQHASHNTLLSLGFRV